MSGYAGDDDGAEHALVLNENAIAAVQRDMVGEVLEECIDCGDDIDQRRVDALRLNGMKCLRCISCQAIDDRKPKVRIRMLDHIL